MELKECVKKFIDMPVMYIGSMGSFLFVGNYDDYQREIKELSEDLLITLEERQDYLKRKLARLSVRGEPRRTADMDADFYEKAMVKYRKGVSEAKRKIGRYQEQIDGFVPMPDRSVRETYRPPCSGRGVVILVEGEEYGDAWTREEYLAKREKNAKKRKKRKEIEKWMTA